MNPITLLVTVIFGVIGTGLFMAQMLQPGIGFFVLALLTFFSLKMANNWERFVILRAGKLSSVKGPGLFRHHPDHRQHHRGDRRAHPDHAVQRRAGADPRHRSGQCRCRDLLARA